VPERASAERADDLVQAGADPRYLGLGDPGLDTHRLDQVVDRAGGDAAHVGLHHHRIQRLIDPPTRLEDRREERPLAQLRDPQLDIARLGREQPCSSAVTVGQPRVGTLVSASADPLRRLQFDQLLQHDTNSITHKISAITSAERLKQLGQGRLSQGHRRDSFSEYLAVHTDDLADDP
jgi:hypothetical protein